MLDHDVYRIQDKRSLYAGVRVSLLPAYRLPSYFHRAYSKWPWTETGNSYSGALVSLVSWVSSMIRDKRVTPDKILRAAIQRLIDVCPGCSQSNTYITSEPSNEPPPSAAEFVYEVCLGPSMRFNMAELTGGGEWDVHVETTLQVTIHSMQQLDAYGKDVHWLLHEGRGLLTKIGAVLASLTDQDLLDSDGNSLLSQPLLPETSEIAPRQVRTSNRATINFLLEFDWWMGIEDQT